MSKPEDPLIGFHFGVEFDGRIHGFYSECSGLGSEHEVTEAQEGGNEPQVIHKVPGRLKWENITLKGGFTKDIDLWNWRQQVIDGDIAGARKDGSIVLFDQRRNEAARWNFKRAWPAKLTVLQLKVDDVEQLSEELAIAHEYLERVS